MTNLCNSLKLLLDKLCFVGHIGAMKIDFKTIVQNNDPLDLAEFLAQKVDLSKIKIKKALENGCCTVQVRGRGKMRKVRKATYKLYPTDGVMFHYDSELKENPELLDQCHPIYEEKNWGVWYKPSGVLSEGNRYGDHLSIMRKLEKSKKEVFLIHRLDREVSGLLLFAYNKFMARFFSEKWREREVGKYYQAIVLGRLPESDSWQTIEKELDGRACTTSYRLIQAFDDYSHVEVKLETGRYHQIRRHFEAIDHPVIGDPRYGKGNKNDKGMMLCHFKQELPTPQKRMITVELPVELRIF